MTPQTAVIATIAGDFFDACEAGKGWQVCSQYCTPNATFAAQAEPLLGIRTLAEYTDWMKAMMAILPDGHFELESFAVDEARSNVVVYATFHGTHTGGGGPVPATGRSVSSDYVYIMQFAADKLVHMTKVWNSGFAMQQLGWV